MLRTDITFQRILDILLPGVLLSIGLWYLYRDAIELFFPVISAAVDGDSAEYNSLWSKLPILMLTSVVLGLIVDHLSDVALIGIVNDRSTSSKARRPDRKFVARLLRIFTYKVVDDPRVKSIRRYLESKKRDVFAEMLSSWAFSKDVDQMSDSEIIISHQHIIARLRASSDFHKKLVEEAYADTSHASSMFSAFALLFFLALIKFPIYEALGREELEFDPVSLTIIILGIYSFAALSGYILKRRFTHYCFQIVTLALHAYYMHEPNKRLGLTENSISLPTATFSTG